MRTAYRILWTGVLALGLSFDGEGGFSQALGSRRSFELYLDHLPECFTHVLTGMTLRPVPGHFPSFRLQVSGGAIWIGEFHVTATEEYGYACRVFVHRHFLTRTYVPTQHPDVVIFELDLTLVGGNLGRILGSEGNCEKQ